MTEFEYLYLFNEYTNSTFTFFSILFSLISAFLVVSYLAARKLSNVVASILLLLFTVSYVVIGGVVFNSGSHTKRFVEKMIESEYDWSWTFLSTIGNEVDILNALVLLGYVCSILFFFYVKIKGVSEEH